MKALCFVGWSGAGKTTLIERLIPKLTARGHRVGYLKSHRGEFAMDRRGKDTYRAFDSGAERVMIVSPNEAAVRFRKPMLEPDVLLDQHFGDCDLVILEGFKSSSLPKIEVVMDEPVLAEGDPSLLAVVSDRPHPLDLPRFARDDVEGVARFVAEVLLG